MIHRLAWSQLMMEKRRLLTALAGISFAVLLQLMQFGFREALFTSATVLHDHFHADLVVVSNLYEYVVSTGSIPRRRLYQAAAVTDVASVAGVSLGLIPFKNPENRLDRRILAIGFDPRQAVLDVPEILAQRAKLEIPDVILFDALSRPEFGAVGDMLAGKEEVVTEVGGRRAWIRGVFNLGVSFGAAGNLVTSDTTFRSWFNRSDASVELGLVTVRPGARVETVQAALRAALPADVRVLTKAEFVAIEHAFWDANTPIGLIFNLGALLGLVVGCVIVYQVLYTDVSNHLNEYATLKAMGYRDRDLHLVVLDEALILSVFGFPVGLALSAVLYSGVRDATHLPVELTVARTVFVFCLTLGMCVLAGAIAMRKLRAADPAEVF